MLDVGVPTELLFGGEDAVGVIDLVGIHLCLPEEGTVEVESRQSFAHAIVKE